MITITIWHNVAHDAGGRHSAMLDGYQPGDPVVAVFTYQADPAGRTAEEIADEAYDTFNDHPRDPDGADLACAYYQRRLRSLSFPGNRLCCPSSCCTRRNVAWLSLEAQTEGPVRALGRALGAAACPGSEARHENGRVAGTVLGLQERSVALWPSGGGVEDC